MQTSSTVTSRDFLLGGGEMGALIRSIDWSTTPVGAIETWPQSLKTAVSMMLNTHFPMYIAWGQEFTQFYNDGYRPILGSTKHPAAMGRSTKFTFAEIWNIIGPMFEGVMEGQAVGFTDFMLPLDRHGFTEECYFIFSYSPIKQEDGTTGGVLVTVTETSERVLGERRLNTLRQLGDRSFHCENIGDTITTVLEVLSGNKHDIPFSLWYSYDASENAYVLDGSTGIDVRNSAPSTEKIVAVANENPLVAIPTSGVFQRPVVSTDQPWPEIAQYCCVCPLSRRDQSEGFGVLLLGVSPRLRYDFQYHNFFKLLSDQVITALTNADSREQERRRVEALAEIDRAKTAFFSNISHEFRTPLTLMLGPLEELLDQGEKLSYVQIENAKTAHRNAMRLLRLVNTLLDFSKIEAGKLEATFRPADIVTFTQDIVSNFRSLIERSGLSLQLEADPITDKVYVDHGMWERIVSNLLSNAFKYTLRGSISVELKQRDQHLSLTVRDTGIGIPENELPRMFERFHRVSGTTGRSFEGTGIGLSLVSELAKIHHGTVSVESKLGEGTAFTVTIPTGYRHLPPERISHDSRDHLASSITESLVSEASVITNDAEVQGNTFKDHELAYSVLVVDDNADMLNYLERILGRIYRVTTATNGRQALEKITSTRPDLILSDIMMPVMDGVELLKTIKANPLTAQIPVVLLSARAGEESRIEGYEVGADDYLTKPFSTRELLARVKAQVSISKKRSHINNLLRQVFEQTPAAIAIISKENYRIEFANKLYLQLADRGQETIGQPLFGAMPELQSQVIPKLLDEVMTRGVPYEGRELEVYLRRHGKHEEAYFNFMYHPLIEPDGTISGAIAVCFEVTDLVIAKRRAEKAEADLEVKVLERTAELEQKNTLLLKANRELEQFAYVASHDLQEPLRKIRTFSSIIERNLPENPESKTYFEKIHASADRMAQLIKDVLNYSRVASHQLSFATVDLNKVLRSVLTDFELMIEELNATITADTLPTINGIEPQLHQLFANLVSNALKFSKEAPVLKISSRRIPENDKKQSSSRAIQGPYIEIRFEDKGIGFDQRYADQIFVIFQRLHDRQTSGTGIGLALCKKIVENHQGTISVKSQPGTGTTFTIRLPIHVKHDLSEPARIANRS
jgi:signal transduction histidine kinase/DNA-binding NarL/FixJ family response regulator